MSKLILWGSSALDFYQHGDFTSLLTLWLDIAHQEDITPNAAAVQYLEDRLPWLSKPFHVIVPSRQQKRKMCAAMSQRRQFSKIAIFALRKDSLLLPPRSPFSKATGVTTLPK